MIITQIPTRRVCFSFHSHWIKCCLTKHIFVVERLDVGLAWIKHKKKKNLTLAWTSCVCGASLHADLVQNCQIPGETKDFNHMGGEADSNGTGNEVCSPCHCDLWPFRISPTVTNPLLCWDNAADSYWAMAFCCFTPHPPYFYALFHAT